MCSVCSGYALLLLPQVAALQKKSEVQALLRDHLSSALTITGPQAGAPLAVRCASASMPVENCWLSMLSMQAQYSFKQNAGTCSSKPIGMRQSTAQHGLTYTNNYIDQSGLLVQDGGCRLLSWRGGCSSSRRVQHFSADTFDPEFAAAFDGPRDGSSSDSESDDDRTVSTGNLCRSDPVIACWSFVSGMQEPVTSSGSACIPL